MLMTMKETIVTRTACEISRKGGAGAPRSPHTKSAARYGGPHVDGERVGRFGVRRRARWRRRVVPGQQVRRRRERTR